MLTSDIEKKLEQAEKFDEDLIRENPCPELSNFLSRCMERAGISRSECISALDLDRSYGYQILNGTRIPTRECLIRMGLLFGLSIEDLQRMLNMAGRHSLYVRDMFDAKVFYAIKHKMSYQAAVAFIWENGL
ncbi:MAG: helix-turn-helix transcriptional regulator [Butyrivibrio sp.]|nr:helix-turn-helix transcriptional regulator [Acetatifactor muris]MCM1559358.1 helix-turn-helix transcriptional regulator [Butyrivibrio sp.]